MVKIKLHGVLGSDILNNFSLDVQSIGEAVHAMNVITKGKLFQKLYKLDKENIRYKVIVNNKPISVDKKIDASNVEEVKNTELCAINKKLKTIDIVPIIEGAEDFFQIFLGVLLIAAAFILPGLSVALTPLLKGALIMGGLGLLAGGVISLLSSPPKFSDFREIDGSSGRTSYLFNGPENTTREGGPVPLGYGLVLVGSQVISSSYIVSDYTYTPDNVASVNKAGQIGGGGFGSKQYF